jgi:hypothetical protein
MSVRRSFSTILSSRERMLALAFAATAACSGPGGAVKSSAPEGAGDPGELAPEDLGTVGLALSTVPSDVHCLRAIVTSDHVVSRMFDMAPGQGASVLMSGLPIGELTLFVETFDATCSNVGPNTSVTWVSAAPVKVETFTQGIKVANIVLTRPGAIQISGDFQNPSLSLSPSAFEFGPTLVGANNSRGFSLVNRGATAFPISMSLTGPSSNEFAIDTTFSSCRSGTSLPAGGSCGIFVDFNPIFAGEKSVTLHAGVDVSAPITGIGATNGRIDLSPAQLDAGPVELGSSETRTLTLTNGSMQPYPVFVAISGSGDFDHVSGTCDPLGDMGLPPGSSCTIIVKFAPTSLGPKTATLLVGTEIPSAALTAPMMGSGEISGGGGSGGSGGSGGGGGGTGGSGAVNLFFEAESGAITSPLQKASDASASGGQFITVAAGNNSQTTPPTTGRATYDFSVNTPGTYKVWGRVMAPTNSDDSFWVSMDGGAFVKWNDIFNRAGGTTWKWDDVRNSDNSNAVVTFNLGTGSHQLVVAYREDGAKLDRILVTSDLASIPQ